MHYKNGRVALEGDSIIGPAWVGRNRIVAGTLHSLTHSTTACNGQVAVAVPGCAVSSVVSVGECLHAEDAMVAWERSQPKCDQEPGVVPAPE